MKMRLTFTAFALTASACAWSGLKLDKVAADPARKVTVQDKRSDEEKLHRRDGVTSPLQYFGDKDFNTPPLEQLSILLGAKLQPGNYDLVVNKFRVIDLFPQRLNAATAGAIAGVLGSMGYAAYFSGSEGTTQDNITCLVNGSLGSKPVDASVSIPYKIAATTMIIKNDPSYKRAVNDCLDQLAEKIAKSP
jgi:hypothetical protein